MKILDLKINNFGKLTNKEIKLEDGINIIYGENESGKSTLLKFIMGMVYGLSKNKNGKFISDYERYTPWDGGEFSGKISYKLDNGERYEVFRDFKKKNPNIYNEELEDISKNFNIDKTTGNKFFYDQTKVDEELFLSTICSVQEETKLEEKEQSALVQKLSNLVSTGEDNISFSKIMTKLNKRQLEEIGTNRTTDRPINIVTKRLEEINNEKEDLLDFRNKQYYIEEKKQSLEEEIKNQENELNLLKELKIIQEKRHLEKEKIKINEDTIKEYNKKIENLNSKNNETKEENSIKQVNKSKINKEKILILAAIIFILTSIISITVIKNDILIAISVVLGVVTLITLGYTQYSKKLGSIKDEKLQNVNNLHIKNEIEILNNSCKKLKKETKIVNEKIEKEYKEETEKLRNKYIGIIPIKVIDEILLKESLIYDINVLQNKISDNKIKLHSTKLDKDNIIPKLENLSSLEEEYSELEEQYMQLYNKNEQINLVKQEIEKAYEIMKKDVTPKFTSNLSKIIEKISTGKYKNVQFDETQGMIVETPNGNYMLAKNLSVGTIDQLYLSLRLSAGTDLSTENLPIILDETFAYWDNKRLENILRYLNEEYKNRQIILFTCTHREKELLTKLGINFNIVNL
ncbi:MAG: AAA family ATPase [Clostridia bacterium]|nr:AAA family ATPase [Clostridia bacterium]